MKLSFKFLISLIAAVFLTSSLLIAFVWKVNQDLSQTQEISSQLITIKQGESLYSLLDELAQKKIITPVWQVKLLSKLNPELTHIRAGTFLLEGQLSSLDVIRIFTQGQPHQFKMTFPEGINFSQWQEKLTQHQWLKQTDYADKLSQLIAPYEHAEGLLFPDTYYFTANSDDFSLIEAAFERMQQTRQQLASALSDEQWYKTLILASIVEKETALVEEMPKVASVFYNRLNKNMRLQTDPTVIYGLGTRYQGDIKRVHLKEKNPYNTYHIKGLTPTPIAMPGLNAIKAVIDPADTDYYYFVADGKGGHVFTTNLKAHNQAVKRYLSLTKPSVNSKN